MHFNVRFVFAFTSLYWMIGFDKMSLDKSASQGSELLLAAYDDAATSMALSCYVRPRSSNYVGVNVL